MVTATLSRGNDSVTIPLVARGGELVLANDVGKPELKIRKGGELNPRFDDRYSGLQTLTLNGQYIGSSAYSDVTDLANFIKSQPDTDTTLSFDGLSEYPDSMTVAPAIGQESPLSITYERGRTDWVEVQLSLSRIDSSTSNASLSASTPTATDSGPIQLQGIDITSKVTVERSVGRPKDSQQRRTNSRLPLYIYKRKPAFDGFSITFKELDNATQTTQDIRDLITNQLGTTPLTLNFNGIFGLGKFNVIPQGSRAFRHIRVAGEEGTVEYPQLRLRRVRS